MSAFEKDDPFASIPDEQAPKPAVPGWNVVAKKKAAKPKEAEQAKTPALPVACKFFKLGKCAAGKGCRFSHDPNAPLAPEEPPPAPTLPCKFHAAGYCRNGPKCPFLHATTKKSAPAVPQSIPTVKPPAQPNGVYSTGLLPPSAPTTTINHTTPPFPHPIPTKQTSPLSTSPARAINDIPFPTARSPTTTQQHANIMNIWPASPPVTSLHPSFFSSSPTSSPSSFSVPSPRHMTNVIPSLASLPSSPSFLSSSPFAMFMSTKPEEDEDDEDDELLPIPGLTIIDDTQDDFVFNPYDDILNEDDDILILNSNKPRTPIAKPNGKIHTTFSTDSNIINGNNTMHNNDMSNNITPDGETSTPAGEGTRTFADIVKTNTLATNTNTNTNTTANANTNININMNINININTTNPTSTNTTATATKSVQLSEEERQQLDDETGNKLCQFYMQGGCRYGTGCRYIHGNMCESCKKYCLLPDNPQQNEEHMLSCTLHMQMLDEREASKDVDCGICYEKTVDKGRRFGLLSHCDHPFCLECIREWRGGTSAPTTTLRSCPICRVTSYYIIPSEGMIVEPQRKQDIIEQYKSKLTTITCKYFNNGKGVCKFGTSCMYSHTNPDGTPYVPPAPRKMQDSEGEVTFYNGLKLSAFFDVM